VAEPHAKDGFDMTEVDKEIFAGHGMQLTGHFLVDREGIVRCVLARLGAQGQDQRAGGA